MGFERQLESALMGRVVDKCGGRAVLSKKTAVVALLSVVVALAACRRETPYEPLKLGADVPAQEEAGR